MKFARLLISAVVFLAVSWLIVHGLALFGFFMALAYPIWWLFMPTKTVCFFCRMREDGEKCWACNHRIHKKHAGTQTPQNLRSVLVNSAVIAVMSVLSIGFVFLENQLLFRSTWQTSAQTATFRIPTRGQYLLGEVFSMKIELTDLPTTINAVQADIGFDPSQVEVVDISTENSFASIFIQKEMNNEVGWARLTGGLPNPGYSEESGVFATVFFRAKEPGVTQIEFLPSSRVLANDGRGTDVLKEFPSVSYLILPESIEDIAPQAQAETPTSNTLLVDTDLTDRPPEPSPRARLHHHRATHFL